MPATVPSSRARSAAAKSAPDCSNPKTASRTPIEKLLPRSLVLTLKHHICRGKDVTAKQARELDERFDITKTHGVSVRRLRGFLRRLQQQVPPEPSPQDRTDAPESPKDWPNRIREHRERQASVAAILDATFGRFAESHPRLWEDRAYLMLVGLVYEQLAHEAGELETKELLTLARVLESSRRGRSDRHPDGRHVNGRANPSTGEGNLPKRFADIVRQVYGTSFQKTS